MTSDSAQGQEALQVYVHTVSEVSDEEVKLAEFRARNIAAATLFEVRLKANQDPLDDPAFQLAVSHAEIAGNALAKARS